MLHLKMFVMWTQSQGRSHNATYGQSASHSVRLDVKPNLGPTIRNVLLFESYGLIIVERPL
jgi:hypothetical protein